MEKIKVGIRCLRPISDSKGNPITLVEYFDKDNKDTSVTPLTIPDSNGFYVVRLQDDGVNHMIQAQGFTDKYLDKERFSYNFSREYLEYTGQLPDDEPVL